MVINHISKIVEKFKKKPKFERKDPTHFEKYRLQKQAKSGLFDFLKDHCSNKKIFHNYLREIDLFIYEIPKLDFEFSVKIISEIKDFLVKNKNNLDSFEKEREFQKLFSHKK